MYVYLYIYIYIYTYILYKWDCFFIAKSRHRLQFPGPPPKLLTDAPRPPIVIGCPPSPLVGSKCTMYAYM